MPELYPLVMGKASALFPRESLCWLGKTLPPHMYWARRVKINRFFNLSKFFYAFSELSQWIQLVVSLPPFFIPNLPRPYVREPVPFVWLSLCLLRRMSLERCVCLAQGKHPSF